MHKSTVMLLRERENPSKKGRAPATKSTYKWLQSRESNPSHIGGGRECSHHCVIPAQCGRETAQSLLLFSATIQDSIFEAKGVPWTAVGLLSVARTTSATVRWRRTKIQSVHHRQDHRKTWLLRQSLEQRDTIVLHSSLLLPVRWFRLYSDFQIERNCWIAISYSTSTSIQHWTVPF